MTDRIAGLQSLYDSEINFSIECFWDGGFTWKLGDEMNGIKAAGHTMTVIEAMANLLHAAHVHYPESSFHLGREEFNRQMESRKAALNDLESTIAELVEAEKRVDG